MENLVSRCRTLYERYREPLLYLFFGGLTTLLNLILFWVLTEPFSVPALTANVIDWVICVIFAYVTNRTWVFQQKARDRAGILREFAGFVAGRLGTLGLEELMLYIGIDRLRLPAMIVKTAAQVLVVVGNYVISKWFVFRDSSE